MLQRTFKNQLQSTIPLVSCCFGGINNPKSSIAVGVSDQICAAMGDELSAVVSDVTLGVETQWSLGCLLSVQCCSMSQPVFWL